MRTRNASIAVAAASAVVLWACGEGDRVTPPETGPPEILSVSLEEGALVRGAVTVDVRAEGADRISLLVDGKAVAAPGPSPYRAVVQTGTLFNDRHELRVTAFGRGGETASRVVPFFADNPENGVAVYLAPGDVELEPGGNLTFEWEILGTDRREATWELEPDFEASYTGLGTVSPDGYYSAPEAKPYPATVHVRLTAAAAPERSAAAAVRIQGGFKPEIRILVTDTEVKAGATLALSAEVAGLPGEPVSWDVVEGESRGTISGESVYTAPLRFPPGATVTIRARSVRLPDLEATLALPLVPALAGKDVEILRRLFLAGESVAEASNLAMDRVVTALGIAAKASRGDVVLGGEIRETAPGRYDFTAAEGNVLLVHPIEGSTFEVRTDRFHPVSWSPGDTGPWAGFAGEFSGTIGEPGSVPLRIVHDSADESDTPFTRSLSGRVELWGGSWTADVEHTGSRAVGLHYDEREDRVTGRMTAGSSSYLIDDSTEISSGNGIDGTYGSWWSWSGSASYEAAGIRIEIRDRVFQGTSTCGGAVCRYEAFEGSGIVSGSAGVAGTFGLPDPAPETEPPSLILALDAGGAVELLRLDGTAAPGP